MSRPARIPMLNGVQSWDAIFDDNLRILLEAPLPIHKDAALTEATLAATFAAAAYDECLVWVNHTVLGYTLYASQGGAWAPLRQRLLASGFSGTTFTVTTAMDVLVFTGGAACVADLPAAAGYAGRLLRASNAGSDTLTLDADGAETITGAGTLVLAVGEFATLYCDGAAWYQVG
jgi:hypothetical protein